MSLRLCHPGRFGDLLWALPTARALAEQDGEHVRLFIPPSIAALKPLLEQQGDYLTAVEVIDDWQVLDTAPASPRTPPGKEYLRSLGYIDWPKLALPYDVANNFNLLDATTDPTFFRPWITMLPLDYNLASGRHRLVVHWTDRWFELKLGILAELKRALSQEVYCQWYAAPGSRMAGAGAVEAGWVALARALSGADLVLTDCSAAHVLAAAVGVRTVLVVEPEPDRHHFIFWPGSTAGWQPADTVLGRMIKPVLGTDGRPTFDSRHTIEAVHAALQEKDR